MFLTFVVRRWTLLFRIVTAALVLLWIKQLSVRHHGKHDTLNNGLYLRKLRDDSLQSAEVHLKKPLVKKANMKLQGEKTKASKFLQYQRFRNKIQLIYEDILNWSRIVSDEELDPLLNRHHFAYHLRSGVCSDGSPDILTFVHSGCENFAKRQLIRKTWGSVKTFKGLSLRTVFMLGETRIQVLQKSLESESLLYGDMVQGNFGDAYKNLTYKHVMSLGWILKACQDVKLIVKVDDDTILNVHNLVDYFQNRAPKNNLLYCSVYYRQGPLRHNRTKWHVSQNEYPFMKFPNYCEGFGYVMSPDVARTLYKASGDARYFWVDDVYVTGILTLKVGLTLSDLTDGYSYRRDEHSNIGVNRAMFMSGVKNWQSMWNKIVPKQSSGVA
ncbi:beta-1,3-galactosyltransferase 5-like [Haliotis asinina]|uniref:beta-1,3-galactosyltransferase 5-like n=1 Tax=Haliotis asinina TaxID=109174 RepID=UPI0035321241